jgi:hypothetical protein
MKRIIPLVGTVLLILAGMFTMLPSANAAAAGAYGCAGSQIDSYPETPNGGTSGTIYGHIYLYYDSATGQNCAVSVATAAGGYGTLTTKKAYIARCVVGTKPGSTCTEVDVFAYDPPSGGNTPLYSQYAGPVRVSATDRCIIVYGRSTATNGLYGYYQSKAVHCG